MTDPDAIDRAVRRLRTWVENAGPDRRAFTINMGQLTSKEDVHATVYVLLAALLAVEQEGDRLGLPGLTIEIALEGVASLARQGYVTDSNAPDADVVDLSAWRERS